MVDSNQHGMPSRDCDNAQGKFRLTGWQRVACLTVVGAAGTATAVLTGSAEVTLAVVASLLRHSL
jgi:hypothetical protein